ncbi:MAG: M20/M25/M40 family metallo-hydrolase [Ruminococcus sp.]|nr:M20/M25/M40 family metallo-hydrolase [Ruminococcus sp.]
MTELISELEELCLINGISGDEGRVREYILSRIKDRCETKTDPLGSIIAVKKGRKPGGRRIAVSAHMDEVGLIVTFITEDGFLKCAPVGGIDPRVVFGRRVIVGDKQIPGVVGAKALHHLSGEEKKKAPDFGEMYIDIGAKDREQAMEFVRPGDSVCFEGSFLRFGRGMIKCKAIDDRVGCAIMIKLICDEEFDSDIIFTFVVQEEVGLRGSTAAAYTAEPEEAYVLEATTAADTPLSGGEKKVCRVGAGPVVSYMDRSTIYSRELYEKAGAAAKELGIKWQTKTMVAGGNDAGAIHKSRGGVKVCGISLACRYLHSPCCVISEEDLGDTYRLVKALLERT